MTQHGRELTQRVIGLSTSGLLELVSIGHAGVEPVRVVSWAIGRAMRRVDIRPTMEKDLTFSSIIFSAI